MKKFIIGTAIAALALMGVTAPASATGDDAVVSATVLINGDIEVTSTKNLSNVHIVVCVEGEVEIEKFNGLDEEVEVFDVEGDLIAVLAKSGKNTTIEAEALLVLLGGTVNGSSTGAIALFDQDALDACGDDEEEEEPPVDVPGPPGPQGPAGPAGPAGEDGVDGRTPIALCWPGLGVGFTFVGEPLPDGAHVLGTGAICPLNGATGAAGPAGPAGPAGADGVVTNSTTTTTTAPPAAAPSELPHTGWGTTMLWIGLALLVSGAAALGLGKFIKFGGAAE